MTLTDSPTRYDIPAFPSFLFLLQLDNNVSSFLIVRFHHTENLPHRVLYVGVFRKLNLHFLSNMAPSSDSALNIIIPMAGLGSRFSNAGYTLPKPLIRVAGRPMIVQLLSNIKLYSDDAIYIGLQKTVEDDYRVSATIQAQLPNLPIHTVLLDGPTRGAADTLHLIIGNMNPEHLHRKTVSLDCDTLYFYDVLAEMRKLPEDSGSVYCFEDEGEKPIYSYIRFDELTKRVEEVREKIKISSHANTGAYGFANARLLSQHLERILEGDLPEKGEFYTSAVISEMIDEGFDFRAVQVQASDFACVGTPKQLRLFLETDVRRENLAKHCKIVFDLETVLQLSGSTWKTEGQILKSLQVKFVAFLQKLKKDGVELELSFRNGYSPDQKEVNLDETDEMEFKYTTVASREQARAQKHLFPVSENFKNVVGW